MKSVYCIYNMLPLLKGEHCYRSQPFQITTIKFVRNIFLDDKFSLFCIILPFSTLKSRKKRGNPRHSRVFLSSYVQKMLYGNSSLKYFLVFCSTLLAGSIFCQDLSQTARSTKYTHCSPYKSRRTESPLCLRRSCSATYPKYCLS